MAPTAGSRSACSWRLEFAGRRRCGRWPGHHPRPPDIRDRRNLARGEGEKVVVQAKARELVESGEGFIHQQDPRRRNDGPGEGYAHLLIDYGPEYNLLWVCFLDDSGECWTYDNTQIRAQKNVTMGRTFVSRHQPRAPSVAAE